MIDKITAKKVRESIEVPNLNNYPAEGLNCYAYSLGITYLTNKFYYYPGFLSSEVKDYDNRTHPCTFSDYYQLIKNDCSILQLKVEPVSFHNDNKIKLAKNENLIGIYHHYLIDMYDDMAAHFVRYDKQNGWSHKRGWHKSPELIYCLPSEIILNEEYVFNLLGCIKIIL